ncbi:MAG: radical SAM protein [Clostridia bacterium]|nr:radical SAM protein [Clostridia bacterium]
MLKKCELCGFKCGIDRTKTSGVCKCGEAPKLALVSKHMWEEPCISGEEGSGTIFFSGCNFSCVFCQNYKISQENFGKEITDERLAEIFLEQQARGVNNINLVSPTPYVPNIIKALDIAKSKGLNIPIVYNTNGYDSVQTIKMLEGYVDVYLPDLKYFDDEIAVKYSKCKNYFEIASDSIKEMIKQVGTPIFDENGIIKKGVIIRHLILPGNIMQTKKILKWIKENLPKDIYISIMAQYFPTYRAKEDEIINRKISKKEYDRVVDLLSGFENGYIQELGEHEEEYVPEFDLSNI